MSGSSYKSSQERNQAKNRKIGPQRFPILYETDLRDFQYIKLLFEYTFNNEYTRLERLNQLLISGQTCKDLLGRHNNKPHVLSPQIIAKIKCHIGPFTTKVSQRLFMRFLQSNIKK